MKNPSQISDIIKIHTPGSFESIQINPSTSKKSPSLSTDTIYKFRVQAGLSLNQTKLILGGIRADLGHHAVPAHYREHASKQGHLLKDFYSVEKLNFITETQSAEPTILKDLWSVWADINNLIEFINNKRQNDSSSEYLIKVMADTGQQMTKVCFCIIPFTEYKNMSRATRSEGGILAKGAIYSGVNKCIMVFCAPKMKKNNQNLEKIFDRIKLNQLLLSYKNVIVTGDFNLLNEVYGLMEASSKHPCIYCTAPAQEIASGTLRTIGTLNYNHNKWKNESGNKNQCKNFFNVKNPPLFIDIPSETLVLSITPPPALHIMLGIFNHIWKNIENISEEHKNSCKEFALRHNCMREDYFGKTFEGNECTTLMNKIESDCTQLSYLPSTRYHIDAMKKLNNVRKQVFGTELGSTWKTSLREFEVAYRNIPNITKPLKVHVLLAHCKEFIVRYGKGKGLGFFSEQTGESIHQKFKPIFERYKIKNTDSEKYGSHLLDAVVAFSSLNI